MFILATRRASIRIVCLLMRRYSELGPVHFKERFMKSWQLVPAALLGVLLLSGSPAIAQGNSEGHGHGKGHDKHHGDDRRDDHDAYRYDYNREAIRGWYSERGSGLPPGLAKKDRLPSMLTAGVYSSTLHYLKAVQAAGTDDAKAVMAKMREIPVNDVMTKNGKLREDGRLVRDMYLFQVKSPQESKSKDDIYTLLATVPGDEAYRPLKDGKCPYIK